MSRTNILFAMIGFGVAINMNSGKEGGNINNNKSEGEVALNSALGKSQSRATFQGVWPHNILHLLEYATKVILH